MRYTFGLVDAKDIKTMKMDMIRMFGEKVFKGDVPVQALEMRFEQRLHFQTIKDMSKEQPTAYTNLNKKIHDNEDILQNPKFSENYYTKTQILELRKKFLWYMSKGKKIYVKHWGKTYNLDKIEVSQLEQYNTYLKELLVQKNLNPKSINRKIEAEARVSDLETQYNISLDARTKFFNTYGIKNIESASDYHILAYRNFIKTNFDPISPQNDVMNSIIEGARNLDNPGINMFSRYLMPGQHLLIHSSDPNLQRVGYALADHGATLHHYRGMGEKHVREIRLFLSKAVKKTKLKNSGEDYIWLFDRARARAAKRQLEKLGNTKELEKIKIFEKLMNKNKNMDKARKSWIKIRKDYWDALVNEVKRSNSPREAESIIANLNQKYVQDYFTRRMTSQAIQHIQRDGKYMEKLVKQNLKDAVEYEAKKKKIKPGSKKYLELFDRNTEAGAKLRAEVADAIWDMMMYGPVKVRPGFLKKRGMLLPEYIVIDTKNGKKRVKTYASNLDGTIDWYVQSMSKYLATVRHFPEWTELGGRYSHQPKRRMDLLETIVKDNEWGAYAKRIVEAELGLDMSHKDVLSNFGQSAIAKWTNFSAVAGLSSPTSGIKNTLIQIPRTAAVYGLRNTMSAMRRAGTAAFFTKQQEKSESYKEAVEKGYIDFGVKAYNLEQIRLLGIKELNAKWWFENVNLMTKTENFNRIVAAEAGRMFFQQTLGSIRGEKSWFSLSSGGLFLGKNQSKRMMKETWKLKPEEIKFLEKAKAEDFVEKGDLNNMYDAIMMKVGHYSHVASAGGTNPSMLPLWMSYKYARPMTLFTRMATSTTFDSYNNYIKPLAKNGNPFPLVKATIGHAIAGNLLYAMYDMLFDRESPASEGSAIDKTLYYIWRGEMLGVFGEVLSPYDREIGFSPVAEPIIVRNAREAANSVASMYYEGESLKNATAEFSKRTIVLLGQASVVWDNYSSPMVGKYKRVRTLENQFREQMGGGYSKTRLSGWNTRQPYYERIKAAIYFGTEEEMAKEYWKTYNVIATQLEREGWDARTVRRRAKQAIKNVVKNMNPISLSVNTKGRDTSKRNEFIDWLSPSSRKLALNAEANFYRKERKFWKVATLDGYRMLWSVHPRYNK